MVHVCTAVKTVPFIGKLEVTLFPPGITILSFGENLSLYCNWINNVELDENIRYTWMLEGNVLQENSSTLMLQYHMIESPKNGGTYQCFVSNNNISLTGTSNKILIVYAPFVAINPSSVSVNRNDMVQLSCIASGHPSPSIEWYKILTDSAFLNYDMVVSYSIEVPASSFNETTSYPFYTNSTLFIDPVDYDDYGYYLCVAALFNDSIEFISTCCNENTDGNLFVDDQYYLSSASTLSGMYSSSISADT